MIGRRQFSAAVAGATAGFASVQVRAQKAYGPGVTDTEIRLGNTAPYSGPVSAYGISARSINAYFKLVNDKGGINGRKITFVTYDDEFAPPKTVEMARRLVEQDNVLMLVGGMGSACNLAIQRYMNAKKVPQMFIAVGGSRFNDPKNAPWTVPFNPSYQGEGALYARHILQNVPNAKVAVLLQNDEMGRDLLAGFRKGLGDKGSIIVAEQSFEVTDPTVDSQMVSLKASGADVLVNLSLSRTAAQAIRKADALGWKPRAHYLIYNSASVKSTFEPAGREASTGIITSSFYKDPGQLALADDPATRAYKAMMARYAPGDDPNNSTAAYGYTVGQALENILQRAGDNLTRENILRLATSIQDLQLPMMRPGVLLNNSAKDYFPVGALQLMRFNGRELESLGTPVRL
nr:ABC transporter substrate-binding protein [Variovorax boronicumulans]